MVTNTAASGRGLGAGLSKRRRALFIAIAALLGVASSLAIAELVLRATGHRPWRNLGLYADEPIMFARDPELGWLPAPGTYVVPPYGPGGPTTRVTVLPDGTRSSGEATNGTPMVMLGCSFTQGVGISDEETFGWRLQRAFPAVHVLNHGVGAYGTYQSLLLMERVFAAPDPPPIVLYGLLEEHEPRNIADPNWLRVLDLYSKDAMIAVPYCTIDRDGGLVRHGPESYPRWPLREHLALIPFAESWYLRAYAGGRAVQGRGVTERLLLEMQRLAEQHGSRFAVVLLHFSPAAKTHYATFLAQHHVDFVDCAFPITAEMRVHGDTHPNGAMNARYAECIADWLSAAGWVSR